MLRRVCFDIQSSYYKEPLAGWLQGPNEARQYFIDETFRFGAATAFDDLDQRYIDFTDYVALFDYLVKADEIITFNGRICDFVVLENLVGEERAKAIWGRPHHDLCGWQGYWKLDGAIRHFLPEMHLHFDDIKGQRAASLRAACRIELGPPDEEGRILNDLAGTYRDVFFTYRLFLKYLESGDSGHTFNDLESLVPKELL